MISKDGATMSEDSSLTPVCNVVTPVGMLGYGLDEAVTASLLADVIPNGAPTAISKSLCSHSEATWLISTFHACSS